MNRFRIVDGTSLTFPKRGRIPEDIPNYHRDPKDPYTFHRDFAEECKHRRWELNTLPCGKVSCNWFCEAKKEIVNVMKCDGCEIREDPTAVTI